MTFEAIHIGMPETDARRLLRVVPGWYADSAFSTVGGDARLRPYFDPRGVRGGLGHDDSFATAWADNTGVIIIWFREGRVANAVFEPMFECDSPIESTLKCCLFDY